MLEAASLTEHSPVKKAKKPTYPPSFLGDVTENRHIILGLKSL